MDPVVGNVLTGVLVAAFGTVGVIAANRFGWMGKRAENEATALTAMLQRITNLEIQNKQCDENLSKVREYADNKIQKLNSRIIQYKHENTTIGLMVDMLLIECPEADEKVKEMRKRMLDRREEIRRAQAEEEAMISGEYHLSTSPDSHQVPPPLPHMDPHSTEGN
jgi:chromosome segregation ATPase